MTVYRFKLYVLGESTRSALAIANLRRICDRELGDDASIEVIDVLAHPEAAEVARILTTPTLVREQPRPERRVIGDLNDEAAVLRALGVVPGGSDHEGPARASPAEPDQGAEG